MLKKNQIFEELAKLDEELAKSDEECVSIFHCFFCNEMMSERTNFEHIAENICSGCFDTGESVHA